MCSKNWQFKCNMPFLESVSHAQQSYFLPKKSNRSYEKKRACQVWTVFNFCLWRSQSWICFGFFLFPLTYCYSFQRAKADVSWWLTLGATGAFVYVIISGQESERQRWHWKPSFEKSSHMWFVVCFPGVRLCLSDKSLDVHYSRMQWHLYRAVQDVALQHIHYSTDQTSCYVVTIMKSHSKYI